MGLLQERSTGLLTTRYGTYDKSLAMLRKWEIDPEIGDFNSSLILATCWSHCLRHTPKSVTSASIPENETTSPFLRLSTDLGGDYRWLDKQHGRTKRIWI